MTFKKSDLDCLADPTVYGSGGQVQNRWGQLLRQTPSTTRIIQRGVQLGALVPLSDVASVHGGVVTRANAFFLVRELPHELIPARFALTDADRKRFAVIRDGTDTVFKVERKYLRPVAKGTDALFSPSEILESDLRLIHVPISKEKLRRRRHSSVLAYLHRGETMDYRVSEDSLKGGIPAQRSNIKNRKPYWYCVSVPEPLGPRIIVPEHPDRRCVATWTTNQDLVIIDKLFVVEPKDGIDTKILTASLNTALSWCQVELRGRTQLGQGALEMKIPEWAGILVINPRCLTESKSRALLEAFRPLETVSIDDTLSAVAAHGQRKFDSLYLKMCGSQKPSEDRLVIERALRTATAERRERRESVAHARKERQRALKTSTSIDAFAAQIATLMDPFPDPRDFLEEASPTNDVAIHGPVTGSIRVGNDLFTLGQVFAGDTRIADTAGSNEADFVCAVLIHDPSLECVDVPDTRILESTINMWKEAVVKWESEFNKTVLSELQGIDQQRTRAQIRRRSRQMLHAE